MYEGVGLGLSIADDEITSAIVDLKSGNITAQNCIGVGRRSSLVAALDELIDSVPGSVDAIGIACDDPATQIALVNLSRRPVASDDDVSTDDSPPAWLAHATITSTAFALTAAVSRQFAGGGWLVVANLDADGVPLPVQPLVLIDPAAKTLIDTAKLPMDTPAIPVNDPAGAEALASVLAAFPIGGRGIELIALAGAGSELPGVAATVASATELPVRLATTGKFAAAHGAALVARRANRTASVTGPGWAARNKIAIIGALGAGVAAAAIAAFVVIPTGDTDEVLTNADLITTRPASVSSTVGSATTTSRSTTSSRRTTSTTTTVTTTSSSAPRSTDNVATVQTTTRVDSPTTYFPGQQPTTDERTPAPIWTPDPDPARPPTTVTTSKPTVTVTTTTTTTPLPTEEVSATP